MKIVVAEKVSPATLELLHSRPGLEVIPHSALGEAGLHAALATADALIVRSGVQVDAALLAHAPKLKVIGRAGVGVDNIDVEAATERGIVVLNTPGANAVAVAELTLGLMLSLARELPRANATMHSGRWEKKTLTGSELRGKTLGILGLGRIGLEVADRARAFGMRLIGHDPFIKHPVASAHEVSLVELDGLFRQSDYLTLHVGLTPQTAHVVNDRRLALMKHSAYILNCARGELIEELALASALRQGRLAGAALDVFDQEPCTTSPVHGLPNVILTPHIGGATHEAQEAVGIQIAGQVVAFLEQGVAQNAVNLLAAAHRQ